MSAKERTPPERLADARAEEILKKVIVNYILTGEPVGSRTVSKMSREGLSPASIRNVMSDLEEMGLLAQPHTSAGRVPTDKGYRYYVDTLLQPARLGSRDKVLIDESLTRIGGEFSEAMEIIPRLLSRLSSQVGYVIAPPIKDAVLKHIEFEAARPEGAVRVRGPVGCRQSPDHRGGRGVRPGQPRARRTLSGRGILRVDAGGDPGPARRPDGDGEGRLRPASQGRRHPGDALPGCRAGRTTARPRGNDQHHETPGVLRRRDDAPVVRDLRAEAPPRQSFGSLHRPAWRAR